MKTIFNFIALWFKISERILILRAKNGCTRCVQGPRHPFYNDQVLLQRGVLVERTQAQTGFIINLI